MVCIFLFFVYCMIFHDDYLPSLNIDGHFSISDNCLVFPLFYNFHDYTCSCPIYFSSAHPIKWYVFFIFVCCGIGVPMMIFTLRYSWSKNEAFVWKNF
jgi:hypothetical protein